MYQNQDIRNKYRNALTELKLTEDKLEEEIGNLRHELRRVRDGIERVGGSSHALEKKAKQLLNNIDLCKSDLKANQKQQEKVSNQLTAL